MASRTVGTALLATVIAAGHAAAQYAPKSLELTPSAGYMFFGNYLEGPLRTSLRNANGPLYGVQLDLNLSRHVGLYGHVGYASSDLQVGVPILGGLNVATSDVILYDGGLELRLPMAATGRSMVPFVQAGAGAIRHEIRNGVVNIDATNTAFNAGIGLDVQFTPAIGLRLMAKDYFGRFDFEDATTFDLRGRTAHNVGLSAGLKVGF